MIQIESFELNPEVHLSRCAPSVDTTPLLSDYRNSQAEMVHSQKICRYFFNRREMLTTHLLVISDDRAGRVLSLIR